MTIRQGSSSRGTIAGYVSCSRLLLNKLKEALGA
jgi:hypothetical protein